MVAISVVYDMLFIPVWYIDMNDIDYGNNELLDLFDAFLSGSVIPRRYMRPRGLTEIVQWLFSFGNTETIMDYHDKCVRYIMCNLIQIPDEIELKKFHDREAESLNFRFEIAFNKRPTSIYVSFFCHDGDDSLYLRITIINRHSYSKLIKPLPRLVRADAHNIREGFFITCKNSKLSMQSAFNS